MPSFIKTAEIGSDDSDNPFDDIPDLEELLTRSMAHKVDSSHNALAGEIAALDDKLAAEKRHSAALTDYGKMIRQKQRLEAQLLELKHEAAVVKKENNSGRKFLKRTRNRSLKVGAQSEKKPLNIELTNPGANSGTSDYSGSESKVFLRQNVVKAIKSMPSPSPPKPYISMPPPSLAKTNRPMPSSAPAKVARSMLLESAVKASRPMPSPSPVTVKAARSVPPTPSKTIKSMPPRRTVKSARSAPSSSQVKSDKSTPSSIEDQIKPVTRSFHREEYTRLSEISTAPRPLKSA